MYLVIKNASCSWYAQYFVDITEQHHIFSINIRNEALLIFDRIIDQGGMAVLCDLPTSDGANTARELGKNAIFCPTDVWVILTFFSYVI